ncbi:hypothetical protein ATANTOWER_006873 [Ataeniobius toweri]|uniref:LRRNT domain-containing protein n=1 Tax=Ataeniobius toweri TaxID=208326 RepID=A0ABU7C0E6_9TELE|nr:hypothetical protein [Ataeniobius toweri]
MRGFGALLAALAVLSAVLRSSEAGVRMQNGAPGVQKAGEATNSSAVGREESSRAAGQTTCPDRCRCEGDGRLHRVDCSDLGLREIPSNMSVFTSYLVCLRRADGRTKTCTDSRSKALWVFIRAAIRN